MILLKSSRKITRKIRTSKTIRHEIKKKQEGGFLGAMMAPIGASLIAPMASSSIQPVASSLINSILEIESQEQEKDKKSKFFCY